MSETITVKSLIDDINNSIKHDIESLNNIESMSVLEKIDRAFRDTTSLEEGIKIGSGRQIQHPRNHSPDIKFIYDIMSEYTQDKISADKTWQSILKHFDTK